MNNRWKNYGLWVSIFAFIPLICDALGFYDIRVILPPNYEKLVVGTLGILSMLGLVNNPTTDNKWYGDDSTLVSPPKKPNTKK